MPNSRPEREHMQKLTTTDHSDEIRTILDTAPVPFLISRRSDGEVLYANERLAVLLEVSLSELIGKKTPDMYADPADRDDLLAKLAQQGRVADHELRLRDPRGHERWALISVAATKLRGEDVLVSGLTEITDRKSAERALAASEQKFRSLVENANDLIYMLTPDGICRYASPNWPEILGREASEVVGQSYSALVHPDDLQACRDFLASVVETGEKQSGIEYRVLHKDGSWRWHTSNASAIKDAAGNVEWFLGIARDITEKKEAQRKLEETLRELRATQAQLVQAEKMAAVSSLVAGISHELNSPVGAISSVQATLSSAVAKLQEALADREAKDVRVPLTVILDSDRVIAEASERINEILRRLRSFARLDEAEVKHADLHEGLENTLAVLQNEIEGRVEVVRDYGNIPPLLCYPAKLNQVFFNVLTNAVEAIEGNGTVTIETRVDGDFARVSVRDTGRGISEEQLKSVFDPGFTTKSGRIGAGLGLSICYQIVQQHGGRLAAESRLGEGSTFTIRVPLKLDRT